MGKGKKSSDKSDQKKKVKVKRPDSGESMEPGTPSATPDGIDEVERAILHLRERGKEDPNLDFVKELRKIQDHISDLKGEERRPITAAAPKKENKKAKKEEEEMSEESRSSDESEKEEEEEEEDADAPLKELINKRLTTCMMLALSFEPDSEYPKDFYQKLSDSNKFKEVTQPFKKEEMQMLNQIIKDRKHIAKKRLEECNQF